MAEKDDKTQDRDLNLQAGRLLQQSNRSLTNYDGIGVNFRQSTRADLDQIAQITASANSRLLDRRSDGPDANFSQFFTEVLLQSESNNGNQSGLVANRQYIDVNKAINTLESQQVQTLLAAESGRLQNYIDYRRIIDMVPQLAQVLDTYVDNIMSPDDFTKVSLTVKYSESLEKEDESLLAYYNKALQRRYKLDKRVLKLVKNSLRDGDAFIAVISLRERIQKYLNESKNASPTEDKDIVALIDSKKAGMEILPTALTRERTNYEQAWKTFLNEDGISLPTLYSTLHENADAVKGKSDGELRSSILQDLQEQARVTAQHTANLINTNVEVFKDSSAFLQEMIQTGLDSGVLEETQQIWATTDGPLRSGADDPMKKLVGPQSDLADNIKTVRAADMTDPKKPKRVRPLGMDGNPLIPGGKFDPELQAINGSALRNLDAERIVKLKDETGCYGYLYFEPLVGLNDMDTAYEAVGSSQYILSQMPTSAFDKTHNTYPYQEKVTYEKRKFIYNLFVRGLSRRIDKKFLVNNREFKDTIYNLLRQDYIVRKRIRVTFFRNEEVVHFGCDDGDNIYYDSIFKPVLFTARLYIALLTNALMFRLVRAPSKRVFYLETGMDNQAGETVNSFIRDIKSKETRFSDISGGDITNMLSLISQFNDIYVPMVDGQKPIEVETITEDSPNFQDDFTEYLMKSMVAGTGTPSAFVNDNESVQFARSLSMENAKYLRGIVRKQIPYADQASELMQRLFYNEYLQDLETAKNQKESDKKKQLGGANFLSKINLEALRIEFPSPASLNTTNIADQINSSEPIITSLMSVLFPEGSESKPEYKIMKKALMRRFIRNLDWDEIDDLLETALREAAAEKVKQTPSGDGQADNSSPY